MTGTPVFGERVLTLAPWVMSFGFFFFSLFYLGLEGLQLAR